MWRRFTRFKDKAYSAVFRKDGQLLVAGGEEGVVRVCISLIIVVGSSDCILCIRDKEGYAGCLQ